MLRFLKRAAGNLQQPFKVVVPSRKLPLNDRRRILAKQLGEFVHIYNKVNKIRLTGVCNKVIRICFVDGHVHKQAPFDSFVAFNLGFCSEGSFYQFYNDSKFCKFEF